jgi:hypothetical protein
VQRFELLFVCLYHLLKRLCAVSFLSAQASHIESRPTQASKCAHIATMITRQHSPQKEKVLVHLSAKILQPAVTQPANARQPPSP